MDNNNHYLNIYQKRLVEENQMLVALDSVDKEVKYISNKEIKMMIVFKNDKRIYLGMNKNYHISGSSNLTEEELTEVLTNIEI